MTRGDVPEWAKKRACEEANNVDDAAFIPEDCSFGPLLAFASYIAQHEEPPVDPLLTATREVLGAWAEDTWGKGACFATEYRSGVLDDDSNFRLALAALKRGMELAKERQP